MTSPDDLNRQFQKIAEVLGDLRPVEQLKSLTELLEAHEALHVQWFQVLGYLDQLRKAEMKLRLDMTKLETLEEVSRCRKQLAQVDEMQKSFMQFQADVHGRASALGHRKWELERYGS